MSDPGLSGFFGKVEPAARRAFFEVARRLSLLEGSEWTPVTFQNAWVNFGDPHAVAAYRKVGDNVQIRGLIKTGTLGVSAFTLPVGFRPPANIIVAQEANGLNGRLTIQSDGQVIPLSGSSAYWSLTSWFSVTP